MRSRSGRTAQQPFLLVSLAACSCGLIAEGREGDPEPHASRPLAVITNDQVQIVELGSHFPFTVLAKTVPRLHGSSVYWSPTGGAIVYASASEEGAHYVYIGEDDGWRPRTLFRAGVLEPPPHWIGAGHYLIFPDGEWRFYEMPDRLVESGLIEPDFSTWRTRDAVVLTMPGGTIWFTSSGEVIEIPLSQPEVAFLNESDSLILAPLEEESLPLQLPDVWIIERAFDQDCVPSPPVSPASCHPSLRGAFELEGSSKVFLIGAAAQDSSSTLELIATDPMADIRLGDPGYGDGYEIVFSWASPEQFTWSSKDGLLVGLPVVPSNEGSRMVRLRAIAGTGEIDLSVVALEALPANGFVFADHWAGYFPPKEGSGVGWQVMDLWADSLEWIPWAVEATSGQRFGDLGAVMFRSTVSRDSIVNQTRFRIFSNPIDSEVNAYEDTFEQLEGEDDLPPFATFKPTPDSNGVLFVRGGVLHYLDLENAKAATGFARVAEGTRISLPEAWDD